MNPHSRIYTTLLALYILNLVALTACASTLPIHSSAPTLPAVTAAVQDTAAASCPITKPVPAKPPKDAAIPDEPTVGFYYQNQDASMMAGAWWWGIETEYLRAGEPGIKTGWFRPAGATLEITGQRLDGPSPPFHADVPCCYPTRFQATGLFFPTAGCWRVTAKAAARELSFVVQVAP